MNETALLSHTIKKNALTHRRKMQKKYIYIFPFKEKQTKWWKDIYAGLTLFFSSCFKTPAMPGSKILSMCVLCAFLLLYSLLFGVIDTLAIATELKKN